MSQPTVGQYMTPAPFTVGVDLSIAAAARLMREHQVRHLPVLSGGKLVGMVTQRDLLLIESLQDVNPEQVTVEEAMTPDPYAISPGTALEWVALEMAQRKFGSTVVVEHGRVVGVFTTIDALRALQELLAHQRAAPHSDPRAR
jgi:acetoin utilization protein AcuB